MLRITWLTIPVLMTAVFLSWSATAQDAEQDKADAPKSEAKPAKEGKSDEKATAEDVEKKAKDLLKPPPTPQPAPRPVPQPPDKTADDNAADDKAGKTGASPRIIRPTRNGASGGVDQPDPRITGTAPGAPEPKLRREGEFIVSRRGRLEPTSDGQAIFVFEADSANADEAPMFIMPCRMLQTMEELNGNRGDATVFVLTGQVFAYRGTNYLLPTLVKPAIDKGNLQQ